MFAHSLGNWPNNIIVKKYYPYSYQIYTESLKNTTPIAAKKMQLVHLI